VGTYTDGLLHWKNGQLTPVLQQSNGLPGNEVRAILTDYQQNLWIGTASGLSVLRPNGALHTYSADDGLPASFIMALQEDEQHRIWVGTGVGVSVFHNGKFEHIDISAMENAEYAFGFLQRTRLYVDDNRPGFAPLSEQRRRNRNGGAQKRSAHRQTVPV
jgi:ligand-binding sensor domain-containing protein